MARCRHRRSAQRQRFACFRHRVRAVLHTRVGDGALIVARFSLRYGRVCRAEQQGEGECADPSSGRHGHLSVSVQCLRLAARDTSVLSEACQEGDGSPQDICTEGVCRTSSSSAPAPRVLRLPICWRAATSRSRCLNARPTSRGSFAGRGSSPAASMRSGTADARRDRQGSGRDCAGAAPRDRPDPAGAAASAQAGLRRRLACQPDPGHGTPAHPQRSGPARLRPGRASTGRRRHLRATGSLVRLRATLGSSCTNRRTGLWCESVEMCADTRRVR